MTVAEDPDAVRGEAPRPPDLSESPEPGGSDIPPPALGSVRNRVARLRERAERTRAGIEARRADSASIDTAFEAVERDAQTGGGVPGSGSGVPPLHVPGSLCLRHRHWLRTGLDSCRAESERRRPIGRYRRAVRQRGRQHQHHVPGQPPLCSVRRRVCHAPHGTLARPGPLDRASVDLEGPTGGQAHALGLADARGVRHRALRRRRPGCLAGHAITRIARRGLAPDRRRLGRRLVSWPRGGCHETSANGGRSCPGLLIVGLGVGFLHLLTITYVVHVVSRKSALYGAIGIALALLLWTYFAGRLLTAAIAANASLWKHRTAQASGNGGSR